jgi:hypothetical protein
MGLSKGGFRVVEAAAGDREVGRPPERARQPPAIAGAAKDVARLGQVLVGDVVVAGGRFDQGEPGERKAASAAVA